MNTVYENHTKQTFLIKLRKNLNNFQGNFSKLNVNFAQVLNRGNFKGDFERLRELKNISRKLQVAT